MLVSNIADTPAHTETLPPPSSTSPPPTVTVTPSPTMRPDPIGCEQPLSNMNILSVNGWRLNQRTVAMLEHAAAIYDGKIDIVNTAITQGSYTPAEPLSFGTHNGGGAVDISVIAREKWEVLVDEIPPLINALRISGFAAWLREPGELSPGSAIHIHAIAVGDPDLSPAASNQLMGEFGYFRGYNGLPQDHGAPIGDKHGGPILCNWMIDLGYRDLRENLD